MSDKLKYELGQTVFCLRNNEVGEIEVINDHQQDKFRYCIRVYFPKLRRSEWYNCQGKYETDDIAPALLIGEERPDFSGRLPNVT